MREPQLSTTEKKIFCREDKKLAGAYYSYEGFVEEKGKTVWEYLGSQPPYASRAKSARINRRDLF